MIILGIDGGGSNLRVAAVDMTDPAAPQIVYEARRGAANPGAIGRDESAARIHDAIAEVRAAVDRPIAAVGIGVAGASPAYADDWLRATIAAVLPGVPCATGTDIEIALVGAHGERRGAMIVAGTGSVALAIADDGRMAQAGGWGYLLGDGGSGYWIGMAGLHLITRIADQGRSVDDRLFLAIMAHIGIESPRDLIPWLYRGGAPDVKAIAALAEVVLEMAEAPDDVLAMGIVSMAAIQLRMILSRAFDQIGTHDLPIAFGGGLLASDNPLSRELVNSYNLPARPEPRYPPVVGAAILARPLIAL